MTVDIDTGLGQDIPPKTKPKFKACYSIANYTPQDEEITKLKNELLEVKRDFADYKFIVEEKIQELIYELNN